MTETGKCNSINTEKNSQMKYDHTSIIPKKWNDPELAKFQYDIGTHLLSKLQKGDCPYCIGKFNVFRNNGVLEDD